MAYIGIDAKKDIRLNATSDLDLTSDSTTIKFGADDDVTLTHVHNTGLLLNSTNQLQFGDSGTYIHQSANGVLDLVSDTEIEINATTIDMNGALDLSGNATFGGTVNIGTTGSLSNNSGTFLIDANTNLNFRGGTQTFDNADGSVEYMRLNSTGLGIGTSPSNKLDIATSDNAYAARIVNNSDGSQGLLIQTSDNDTSEYILNLQSSTSATGTNYSSKFAVSKYGTTTITNETSGAAVLQVRNFATSSTGAFTGSYASEFRTVTATSTHGMLIHHAENNASRRTLDVTDNTGTTATFVQGRVGINTTNPISYANGEATLFIEDSGNPAITISDTGQTYDYFIVANGSRLGIVYGQGSNSSSASNITEIASFNNNGRVGIGTDSPDSPLEVSDGVENYRIDFGTNEVYLMARNASAYIEAEYIAESHEFRGYGNDSGNLAMKIDSSANILFGSASTSAPSFSFNPDSGGGKMVSIKDSTNSRTHYEFHNPNGTIGSITTSSSSTAFNTSSDYRLKENVVTDWDATSRLKQLKPSRFNFKDNKDLTVDGFLAHEVSSIVPEAVTGTKDETEKISNVVLNADGTVLIHSVSKEKWEADKLPTTDADGNEKEPLYSSDTTWVESKIIPKYQGIDQSKLVPLLVKTIQELETRIAKLEGV